jgi:N-acetylglucosamine repressor
MDKRQLLKVLNRASILKVIKARGSIARTDIARRTGLSPAAVTGLTAQLIDDGLIYEKQEGDSRGGRRPILLALDATRAYVIGIKLAEERAWLALTNLNAQVTHKHTLDLRTRDPQAICTQLADAIYMLLRSAQVDGSQLLGIGIGIAGIVDTVNGICRLSPHLGWRDVPFAGLLEDCVDYPVYLDNDVNTLTLVEQLYGPGQHVPDFLVVTLGRGVGMGIVANGQVYRGARGGGGEFGHIVVDPEGFLCSCGNRGCLETFVAEPWLLQRARMNGLDVRAPDSLVTAARSGHPVALDVFQRAGEILGRGLAATINLLNPALIILSGEGIRARDFILETMHDAMRRHTFGVLIDDVEVRVDPLSDDAWARGAASLVLDKIFQTPDLAPESTVLT